MCGICGIINFNNEPVAENHLLNMMRKMKHRGPDDEGFFLDHSVGLGFTRLSIIDLTMYGHQPMFSRDKRYVVVFNGEIYNYIELKEELGKKGFLFTTRTDTEVLLAAFETWGENCLDYFNGMWAFVIYDTLNKKIFAARDRFGVKPFYYYYDKDRFMFASEIPPLLTVLGHKPTANDQAIFDYLAFNRTDHEADTFFKEIKKLNHGHKISIQTNHHSRMKISRWYHLKDHIHESEIRIEEYKDLLYSAVSLRLRSDVPVGVCLSGGLDSSSIVSILLNRFSIDGLNTFSVVYKRNEPEDESEYIDEYKESINNMRYARPDAASLLKDLNKFIQFHSEPVPDTSIYAQFKLMELAHNFVGVLLDGQGADEQLAGYHYFFGFYFKELLQRRKYAVLFNEFTQWGKNYLFKNMEGLQSFFFFLLSPRMQTILSAQKKELINEDLFHQFSKSTQIPIVLYKPKTLNEALLAHFEYKLEHLLKWEDINSMAFSIEARVPFLDYRLVERTLSLPPDMKIRNGMTKFILREAMKDILPRKIYERKSKIGFETPEKTWFEERIVIDYIRDFVESNMFYTRGYFNPKKLSTKLNDYLCQKRSMKTGLWKILNLELWFRTHIEGNVDV